MNSIARFTLLAFLFGTCLAAQAQLRIPANTAYLDPVRSRTRVNEDAGITHWTDPATKVIWYGELKQTGTLNCMVELKPPVVANAKYRLTVAGKAREVALPSADKTPIQLDFGPFDIATNGYHSFQLEALNKPGDANGDIEALLLSGSATNGAHFNLKSRRNAASVHLAYPVAKDLKVDAFYCEVTAVEDPVWTFYMACGWHRGYFGMQVNSTRERRIIFSVWDSGNEAIDRDKVADENRVKLIGKGEGVYSGDFGNEGTGGHSHLKYLWKTGEKQKFFMTAQPVGTNQTIFSGYYFHPDDNKWMLISSWRAPKEGGYLRGLHSFSENFGGDNGHILRKALYGNQWMRTTDGQWHELTTATFSHDATGKADRLDRFMGLEKGEFFLSHGGFVTGYSKFGDKFDRPALGKAPVDIELPPLPSQTSADR